MNQGAIKSLKHLASALTIAAFSLLALASSEESVEEDISGRNPDITISAQELYKAYEANEVAADTKYKGKILQVSGTVNDIGKDLTDTIYVTLSSGGEYSITSVQCFFSNAHTRDAAGLNKGDKVSIKGRCEGQIMNVLLRGCTLVK